MISNVSFVKKIITIVSTSFVLFFGISYFVIFSNYKHILLQQEADKIDILLDTIAPTVQINLEFDTKENINIAFEQLLNTNKNIQFIKLMNLNHDVIIKNIRTKNIKNVIFRTKEIKDNITNNVVAYLRMSYSHVDYINSVKQFQNMFIIITIASIIFLVLFMKFLYYMFKPILDISKQLEEFNPEKIESFHIEKIKGKDEIAIINNAIFNMLLKIKSHTNTLKQKVKDEVEKNRKKDQQILQQSRLAQMGEMISMIAHQWRQPLSAISSSVISIQSKLSIGKFDLSKDAERDKFLYFLDKKHTSINEYVQTLSETIDDFRNFFKPNKQKENISLGEPVTRALKIVLTSMNNKGININYKDNINNKILIYPNEMMQVILNILKNSEDNFFEKNIQNPQINITTSNQNNIYIIKISDNGGGIPEDILPNIFNPYFSTKSERNGTGLGLYMSKIMVEEHHNGKLEVLNIGDGVKFSIILRDEKNV